MTEMKIIMHPAHLGARGGDDLIDTALRLIGIAFGEEGEWADKYGATYENGVFMMHRYCWCEKRDCLWCCIWLSNEEPCSEAEAEAHRANHERLVRERYGEWAAKHPGAPHFWYKPSGFQLRWYKYIGRDMEVNSDQLPGDFLHRIFETHPRGMTIEDAIGEIERRTEERSRSWNEMLAEVARGIETGGGDAS